MTGTGARMEMEEVGGTAGTERGAMPIFFGCVSGPWLLRVLNVVKIPLGVCLCCRCAALDGVVPGGDGRRRLGRDNDLKVGRMEVVAAIKTCRRRRLLV